MRVISIKYIPEKTVKTHRNIIPRDRRILMRRGITFSKHLNKQLNDRVKSLLEEELKFENKLKLSHPKEREERETCAVDNIKRHHEAFYSLVSETTSVRYKIKLLLNKHHSLTSDTEKISEALKEQFRSVISSPLENIKLNSPGDFSMH